MSETHLPPTPAPTCHVVYRAPVYDSAAGCWLVFDAVLLDAAPGSRPPQQTLTLRVRTQMAALICGSCTIEAVATALGLSVRTVQRRLESEGTTFGALLDETRREAALEYLRDPQIAIKEAAYRVGFSEPSTFYRAFRRWTGATPADYRRSLSA